MQGMKPHGLFFGKYTTPSLYADTPAASYDDSFYLPLFAGLYRQILYTNDIIAINNMAYKILFDKIRYLQCAGQAFTSLHLAATKISQCP